jgi:hypothetical protein
MGDAATLARPTLSDGEGSVIRYFERAREHLKKLPSDSAREDWLRLEQSRFEAAFAGFEKAVRDGESTKAGETAWAYSQTIVTLASLRCAFRDQQRGLPMAPWEHLDRYLGDMKIEAPRLAEALGGGR